MKNLTIYTEGKISTVENICKKVVDIEVLVKDIDELTNIDIDTTQAIVLEISQEKLKCKVF